MSTADSAIFSPSRPTSMIGFADSDFQSLSPIHTESQLHRASNVSLPSNLHRSFRLSIQPATPPKQEKNNNNHFRWGSTATLPTVPASNDSGVSQSSSKDISFYQRIKKQRQSQNDIEFDIKLKKRFESTRSRLLFDRLNTRGFSNLARKRHDLIKQTQFSEEFDSNVDNQNNNTIDDQHIKQTNSSNNNNGSKNTNQDQIVYFFQHSVNFQTRKDMHINRILNNISSTHNKSNNSAINTSVQIEKSPSKHRLKFHRGALYIPQQQSSHQSYQTSPLHTLHNSVMQPTSTAQLSSPDSHYNNLLLLKQMHLQQQQQSQMLQQQQQQQQKQQQFSPSPKEKSSGITFNPKEFRKNQSLNLTFNNHNASTSLTRNRNGSKHARRHQSQCAISDEDLQLYQAQLQEEAQSQSPITKSIQSKAIFDFLTKKSPSKSQSKLATDKSASMNKSNNSCYSTTIPFSSSSSAASNSLLNSPQIKVDFNRPSILQQQQPPLHQFQLQSAKLNSFSAQRPLQKNSLTLSLRRFNGSQIISSTNIKTEPSYDNSPTTTTTTPQQKQNPMIQNQIFLNFDDKKVSNNQIEVASPLRKSVRIQA